MKKRLICLGMAMVLAFMLAGCTGPNYSQPSLVYDVYAGPVMPLSLAEPVEGLNTERDVTYDFSYYSEAHHEIVRVHTDVTDSYVLTNTTHEDITVEAMYPFMAKLQDMEWLIPEIYINDEAAETTLMVGDDLGKGMLMNSGEKLIGTLADGTYVQEAFGLPAALDQPCIVYRIGNFQYHGDVGGEITLEFSFHEDPHENRVLMYGVRSFGFRHQTNRFSVHMDRMGALYEGDMYVILMDRDIDTYALQAYSTPNCKEGSEVEGFTADVSRTETTLGEWMAENIDWEDWKKIYNDGLNQCIVYGLPHEEMLHYASDRLLAGDVIHPVANGSIVMLDDFISDTLYADRMLYLTFPITVPKGESVTVRAESVKYSSGMYDGRSKEDVHSYELMTQLGSCLSFAKQTASVTATEGITVADSNFGFDLEQGITAVTLDPDVEHYWIQVKKK